MLSPESPARRRLGFFCSTNGTKNNISRGWSLCRFYRRNKNTVCKARVPPPLRDGQVLGEDFAFKFASDSQRIYLPSLLSSQKLNPYTLHCIALHSNTFLLGPGSALRFPSTPFSYLSPSNRKTLRPRQYVPPLQNSHDGVCVCMVGTPT